jgi:hypothetical protein
MNNEDKALPAIEFRWIGKDEAEALLALNKPYQVGVAGTNRPLRRAVVEKYAKDMLAGKWRPTHQGIALIGDPANPTLGDGQHRLHAVLLACETKPDFKVILPIATGLDFEALWVIDAALPRTNADVIAMKDGVRNPNVITSSLRLVNLYQNVPYSAHAWASYRSSHMETLGVLEAHPGIHDAYDLALGRGVAVPLSPLTAGVYLFTQGRPDIDIKEFLDALKHGANLPEKSPILALRNAGLNARQASNRRDTAYTLACLIKAVNKWVANEESYYIRFLPSEPFPRITQAPWVTR